MIKPLYSNDKAVPVSWLVYVNGLQVPAQAVSVSSGLGAIPQAQISFVPDPSLQRLGAEDRVQVQIFYLDVWVGAPEYRLLFDGEIVAWGHTSTTGSRSLVLHAVDYTQILSQLFFFFMSSYDDLAIGLSGQQLGVQGATVQTAGYGALYPYSLFSQGLASPGDTTASNAVIERPIDFAYNIVRALIKDQHPNKPIPAVNFFTPWVKRTNYHRRWVALPYLDSDPGGNVNVGVFPILRAVQNEQALSAVSRLASNVGSGGSIWAMLNEILGTMMMEIAMIPTPAYVRTDFASLLPKAPSNEANGFRFLTNYFIKPQFFFGLPPACNVFFPSQIAAYQYNENFITQPTRMYFNEEAILAHLNANGATADGGLNAIFQDTLCTAYPEEADIAARDAVQNRGQNGKNLLVYPEEFFKGPVIDRRVMPRWFVFLADALATVGAPDSNAAPANLLVEDDEAGPGYQTRPVTPADSLNGADASLYGGAPGSPNAYRVGQCVAPQRWMLGQGVGSVKGGQYGPFLWGQPRGHNGERTHDGHDVSAPLGSPVYATVSGTVFVKTWNGNRETQPAGNYVRIRDGAEGEHYFMHLREAPQELQGRLVDVGDLIGYVGSTGRSDGPHVHYEVRTNTQHALNYSTRLLALRSGNPPDSSPVTSAQPANTPPPAAPSPSANMTDATSVQTPGAPSRDTLRNLFYTYAQYEYYKERYARRTGALSLAFNPYPVPGFPCATFDRRSSACDTFGYITGVSHSLTSGSMSTDVQFSHGRTFQEMFALMQRAAALTNARVANDRDAVESALARRTAGSTEQEALEQVSSQAPAVNTGHDDVTIDTELSSYEIPQGGLAMAPSEPIAEIRDVIQTFRLAQEFYSGLFYGGTSVGADRLRQEQMAVESFPGSARPVAVSYARAGELYAAQAVAGSQVIGTDDPALSGAQITESVATFNETTRTAIEEANRQSAQVTQSTIASAAVDSIPTNAVFDYRDIIELETFDGTIIPVEIGGLDTSTRTRFLQIVRDVRRGVASETDLNLLRERLSDTTISNPASGTAVSDSLNYLLVGLERELRLTAPSVTVRGDVSIIPRASAKPLFESFEAAQKYNARPIVTLEQYIDFLGPDGLREGPQEVADGVRDRNPQVMPAKFYTRIRRFRQGPPEVRPQSNVTGTAVSTDVAAGPGAAAPTPSTVRELLSQAQLTGLGEQLAGDDFSAALAQARQSAGLPNIPIDLEARTDPVTLRAIVRDIDAAADIGAIDPATARRARTALENAARTLDGTTAAPSPSSAQGAGSTSNTQSAPAGTDGESVYVVDGVPTDFPETRANWDAVLERYRDIVLNRKAPLP